MKIKKIKKNLYFIENYYNLIYILISILYTILIKIKFCVCNIYV